MLSLPQSEEISESAFARVGVPTGSEKASHALVNAHGGTLVTEFLGAISEISHFVCSIILLLLGRKVS